jgi:hypothetical protein
LGSRGFPLSVDPKYPTQKRCACRANKRRNTRGSIGSIGDASDCSTAACTPGETYLLEWRVQCMNGGTATRRALHAPDYLPEIENFGWFAQLSPPVLKMIASQPRGVRVIQQCGFGVWGAPHPGFLLVYYYLVMIMTVTDWSATRQKKKQLWRVGCILRLYQQHTKHVSSVLTVRRSWTIIYPLRYI